MKALAPRVGPPGSRSNEIAAAGTKRKRAVACRPCRERKTACDGTRPTCAGCRTRNVICHYLTESESETRFQALRREHKDLTDLVEQLRTSPEDTAQALLFQLRNSSHPLSFLRKHEKGQVLQQPRPSVEDLSPLLPTHGEPTIGLVAQHQGAYPALDLSRSAILSKQTLIDPAKLKERRPSGASTLSLPSASGPDPTGPSEEWRESDAEAESRSPLDSEPKNLNDAQKRKASESRYLAPLLAGLNIAFWTSVQVTNQFAANAITLFLEADHEVLGLFDTVPFLNDLLHMRDGDCSAFLVNSLLAFASQAYSTEDPSAAEKSLQFEAEAQRLLRAQPDDHAQTVAGLMLLCLSRGTHGNVLDSKEYAREASEMAKRMKLFGVKHAIGAEQISSLSKAAQRTLAQITWGVFNMQYLFAQMAIFVPEEFHPKLNIPPASGGVRFNDRKGNFVRLKVEASTYSDVFPYFCRLSKIQASALIILRDPDRARPPPLAFSFSKYKALLEVMDDLPDGLRRHKSRTLAAVLVLHMTLHQFIMDLFRPFITNKQNKVALESNDLRNVPNIIFEASTKQLKSLMIEYTSHIYVASRSAMWHFVLLYTADAVLRDTSQPDWKFYFLLCIHCYAKINDAFPFGEGAIQSMLALAIGRRAITEDDATKILRATLHRKKRQNTRAIRPTNAFATELIGAIGEVEATATSELVKRFEEFSVFDEFTTDVL